MNDNVYVWTTQQGILISRGFTIQEALKNLLKNYREDDLVEFYSILEYDGYYMGPSITLYGNPQDAPYDYLYNASVIIDLKHTVEIRNKDVQ